MISHSPLRKVGIVADIHYVQHRLSGGHHLTSRTNLGLRLGVVLVLFSAMLVSLAVPVGASVECQGLVATIVGTGADETLKGTSGDDVIHGRGGDDIIKGKGGNDIICGGGGADLIEGGAGDDLILGGAGADVISGGDGADDLRGGSGDDDIAGNAGADSIVGGDDADQLEGKLGNDYLEGNRGDDTLLGGGGAGDVAKGGKGSDACESETETNCETDPIDFWIERIYVNQAVPAADSAEGSGKRENSVEGRKGIVRVFAAATREEPAFAPVIKMHFRDGDGNTGVKTLNGPSPVPTNPKEAKLKDTFEFSFGKAFLDVGMEVWFEIDPQNEVKESDEDNNRFPGDGWYNLKVKKVPRFDATVVPMNVNGVTPSVNLQTAKNLLADTLKIHPIADYDIDVRSQPVEYNGSSWSDMLSELTQAWADDVNSGATTTDRFYVGIVDDSALGGSIGGIGWVGGYPVSLSLPHERIIAHEVGHNLSLWHAPCGVQTDPDYPYPHDGAGLGVWGYDIEDKKLYNPNQYVDVMSYCGPTWISDFHYQRALDFRKAAGLFIQQAGPGETVVTFGGSAGADTTLDTVEVTAGTVLPPPYGDYTIVGRDAAGAIRISVPFAPMHYEATDDAASGEGFFFSVAVDTVDLVHVRTWEVRRNGAVLATR